ncbi:34383_t:CDS:2, partial [Racocetra persica]
ISKAHYTTLKYLTGLSPKSIKKYTKIFHDLIINTLTVNDSRLGGERKIVKIDESKFKKDVLLNTNTLTRIIKKHVIPGTKIYLDSWRGYQELEKLEMKHIH